MKPRWKRVAVCLAALGAGAAVMAWYTLFRTVEARFDSDVEHFKYGTVGVEASSGLPYWVWYVMPTVCEGAPAGQAGYARFGFTWEKGQSSPIGLPVTTVGFPRVGINCALCHVGTVRATPTADRQLLPGAPASRIDLQAYLRFLFSCGENPRFNADNVLAEIDKVHPLPIQEALVYRYLVIPSMKQALAAQKAQLAWMDSNPDWGPGRSDPFNPAKGQLLRLASDGTIGNSDAMPLWNMRAREGHGLHWDGLNDALEEIVLNSGIGNGASAHSIHVPGLRRMQSWVMDLKPPTYPFAIDTQHAAEGGKVFQAECAACHAAGGSRTGQAVALAELGTDAHRLASWSQHVADRFNGLDGYDWRYKRFRPTYGYVAVPLDGVWARAPYLHNGSVPTLADLLKPPSERPVRFYRGYDVYDPERAGFVSDGPAASAEGWLLDTSAPGNSNAGHPWGTGLAEAAKRDLIEYLKTL
jgi:hypothetical protein